MRNRADKKLQTDRPGRTAVLKVFYQKYNLFSSIQQGHRHKENDKKGLSSWKFYLIN